MAVKLKGFKPILGKVLFLGTCVGKTSMDCGFYYMDKGNDFWKLIDEVCHTNNFFTSKRDEYIENFQNRDSIEKDIRNELEKFNIGLSDIIYSCENKTNSSDNGIIPESIVYNEKLSELIKEAKVIVLNGKGRTKKEFYRAIKCKHIDLDKKKIVLVVDSSSGANRKYKERRKKEWKEIFKISEKLG